MGRRLVLVAVLVLRLGMMGGVDPVQAEWYLAGQGGQQIPQDLTNIRGTGNLDRKSTRLNSSHSQQSRMPSSA